MKTLDIDFINQLKNSAKQQKIRVTFDDVVIDENNINQVQVYYEGQLLKSVMKNVEIDSNIDIPVDKKIKIEFGLKNNDEYIFITLGYFKVISSEKNEQYYSYKIKCCDLIVESMKDYEVVRTDFPCTLNDYVFDLCQKLGYNFNYESFTNSNIIINSDPFLNIGYKYRDVLDDIAEATGTTIYIDNNNLILGTINKTDFVIEEENIKDTNTIIGKHYGEINSIVLSRNDEDNIYYKDTESIEKNGLCEFKIFDNQLMFGNNRVEYITGIANNLFGVNFYINDLDTYGVIVLDLLDEYYINVRGQMYNCVMLADDLIINQGVDETIYTDEPITTTTDYSKADKTDLRINQTYRIVDKQNQKIESVITNVGKQDSKISKIEQTVDELNSKITDEIDITKYGESYEGYIQLTDVNEGYPININVKPTIENISRIYPNKRLFPSKQLFMKSNKIEFYNIETDEKFYLKLPMDLLKYNDDIYDEFSLSYDNQKMSVVKRCRFDENGNVVIREIEETIDFDFPDIELTDGSYNIKLVGNKGYLSCRLLGKNIYTSQFVTLVKLESDLRQTSTDITASVDEKFNSYSSTTEMNAAINVKANEITSSVSKTYATKNELQTQKTEIKQTTDSISASVWNNNTKANIVAKINDNTSNVQINADNVNLWGKRIDLTAENVSIGSNRFNVDRYGNMSCSNANISGYIHATDGVFNGNINMSSDKSLTSYHANGTIASKIDKYGLKVYSDWGSYEGQFTAYGGLIDGVYTEGIAMALANDTSDIILTNVGVFSNQKFYAPGFYNNSKVELKENINKLNINAVEEIKNTDVYKFNYKNDINKEDVIGFVIGENYNISDLIHNNSAVNLYSSVGLLFKAIQEQQEQIEDLKNEIKKLKGE